MTEAQYLACSSPAELIGFPDDFALWRNEAKRRKVRLWIAACLEAHPPPYLLSWSPYEAYDMWREGKEDGAERGDPTYLYTYARYWSKVDEPWETPEMLPARAALWREVMGPYRAVVLPVEHRSGCDAMPHAAERAYSSCSCPCPWITHESGRVPRMAEAIYQSRCWEEMGQLSDALIEAGCDNEELIRHLRGEEPCPAHPTSDLSKYTGEWVQGKGIWSGMKGPKGPLLCDRCGAMSNAAGWIPLRAPHVRGDWVLDLLRGQS